MQAEEIRRLAALRRADAVTMIHNAASGHTGGTMSAMDALCVLFYDVLRLRPAKPDWPQRDRFLLSKGHCVEGYCAILADLGFFDKNELRSFCRKGSRLIGHPGNAVPGVEVCTGALGHGLPIGVGAALGAKRTGRDFRTFVLLGDGELAEGSVWEAAMAGAAYRLDDLFVLIDRNGLQISGTTEEVMPLEDLAAKWRAFGWDTETVDGHDVSALLSYFHTPRPQGRPHCLLLRTVKGKGLPFAENRREWQGPGCAAVAGSLPRFACERRGHSMDGWKTQAARAAFTKTLLELAEKDPTLFAVATDSRGSVTLTDFAAALPNQFVECGIAEQDAVGIAAGLANAGLRPFVCGPASFLSLRAVPGLEIFLPADAVQTALLTRCLAAFDRPAYVRMGRGPVPTINGVVARFVSGRAN